MCFEFPNTRAARIIARLLIFGCLGAAAWNQVTAAQAQSASRPPDLSRLSAQFTQYFQAGRYTEAQPLAQQLVDRCEGYFGRNNIQCAWAVYNLALVYHAESLTLQAEPLYERALATREKALGADHPDVVQTMQNLAMAYQSDAKYPEAELLYQRLLAIRERTHQPDDLGALVILDNLSFIYHTERKLAQAEPFYRRALAVREKTPGTNQLELATNLINLAKVSSNDSQAQALFQRAIEIEEGLLGFDRPDAGIRRSLSEAYQSAGLSYDAAGDLLGAESIYRRAVAFFRRLDGSGGTETAEATNWLVEVLKREKKFAEGEAAYKSLLQAREQALGSRDPAIAETAEQLGALYAEQEKYVEAEALFRRVLSIREDKFGPDNPTVAKALSALADAKNGQQRYAEAETLYKRALTIQETAISKNLPDVLHADAAETTIKLVDLYKSMKIEDAEENAFKRHLALTEQALAAQEPGVYPSSVTQALGGIAYMYDQRGQYSKEIPYLERMIGLQEQEYDPTPSLFTIGDPFQHLSEIYDKLARYQDAYQVKLRNLEIVQREMAHREKKAADARNAQTDDGFEWANARDDLIRILQDVTKVQIELDRPDQALVLYRKAIELLSIGKPNLSLHCDVLLSEAEVYDAMGRRKEAYAALDGVIAVYERDAAAAEHDMFLTTTCVVNDPITAFAEHGRYTEAEKILKLALRKTDPSKKDQQSPVFEKLADIYDRLGRYAEAEAAYKQALPAGELKAAEVGPGSASVLIRLMFFYHAHGHHDEALKILRVLEEIDRELLKKQSSDARYLVFRGLIYQQMGMVEEAQQSFMQAVPLLQKEEPTPKLAAVFDEIAFGYLRRGTADLALGFSRLATETAAGDHALAEARRNLTVLGIAPMSGDRNREIEKFSFFGILPHDDKYHVDYFGHHLTSLAEVDRKQPLGHQQLGREALIISQRAYSSLTAAALQQTVVRFATTGGALADLVRESQDLAAFERDEDKRLADELSKPLSAQDAKLIDALRKAIEAIENKLSVNTARIEREFPDYATFASPKPLKAEDVQSLLGPDEAMLFYLVAEKETYAFTVTRENFDWKVIPIGGAAMADKVARFRRGLDVDQLSAALANSEGRAQLFDLDLAHELYTTLVGAFGSIVKDKKKLLIVPTGALTALPFHLLVTEKPAVGIPEKLEGYREAAWLIKRQAITVLPSVSSLKALRMFASDRRPAKPMVGFGDPAFNPNAKPSTRARIVLNSNARNLAKQAYGDFWQGPQVDRTKLAQGLPQLPDTADELQAVAKDVGASRSDIHLGKDASETTVKRLPLVDYRIVYFATHGLVAGTVKGLGEPSLALSIPAQPSQLDDGLLTASEVAQLKLNADWVVLSACNTAAGDSPDAEALSGLARAFFYAGARALLVSHWAMSSEAATRLTTSTFDILKADPTLDRAEALRRAELAYLNDTTDPRNAYPAFWAPFEIVGEGANRPVARR